MHSNGRVSPALVGYSISYKSVSVPSRHQHGKRLLYSHKSNVIESRRAVISLEYTDGDVVRLIQTEVGAKECDTLVGHAERSGGDVYHDRNIVHDDLHELT